MKPVKVIIETPKGSALKYQYDMNSHLFNLKKILPAGMIFPYDFGFIPGTQGEDGDPLDILVISVFHSFPGCVMECRIIGGFMAEQTEKESGHKAIRNDRFFAVPVLSTIFSGIKSLKDLPEKTLSEIEKFFIHYNKMEGKDFKILEKMNPKKAQEVLNGE
ncbi:MAG: inorganic diphosphatase [Chitinophagaceae bacterium]|nr:inorganic diphosphatase [Chitinophagaceae bacterium]